MSMLTSKKLGAINAEILLIFGALQPSVPELYYHTKINVIHQYHHPGYPEIELSLPEKITSPVVASETETQEAENYQTNIQCLKTHILETYPLLPEEIIFSENMTYLLESFENYPIGTLVYHCETNRAHLYFLLKNLYVDEKKNIHLRKKEIVESVGFCNSVIPTNLLSINIKSTAITIGKGIASSLLSTIGGVIVDIIMDELFPEQVPDYFDEVYAKITKIVKQEIEKSSIDSIEGSLHNLIAAMRNEYTPALKARNLDNEKERQFLFDLLQKYDQTFLSGTSGMLGFLQLEDHMKAGFTIFMLGASLRLSLIQEMARVDPLNRSADGTWNAPETSSYGKPHDGTLARTAKDFIKHAEKAYEAVITARREAIQPQKFQHSKSSVIGTTVVTDTTYYVRATDSGTPTSLIWKIQADDKNGNNPDYDHFVASALKDYRNRKVKEFIEEMGHPKEIIDSWQKLIETPVKSV